MNGRSSSNGNIHDMHITPPPADSAPSDDMYHMTIEVEHDSNEDNCASEYHYDHTFDYDKKASAVIDTPWLPSVQITSTPKVRRLPIPQINLPPDPASTLRHTVSSLPDPDY